VGLDGDVKLVHALTFEYIADAVVASSVATRSEIDELARDLYSLRRMAKP
jgi:hypothetical protein